MNETRAPAAGRLGLGPASPPQGRLSPLPAEASAAGRCAIGALLVMIATATGCGSGRGEGAISGPISDSISGSRSGQASSQTSGLISGPVSTPLIAPTPPAAIADESAPAAPVFHADDPHRKGVIHADLVSTAAVFRPTGYNTLIVHVRSASVANLVARVKSELAASRQVVLDSDGDEQGKALVSDIARAATGGGPKTEGALIFMVQEGVYAVTPLETVATHRRRQISAGKQLSAGNTARYALGID
jgi:hypothetical protein